MRVALIGGMDRLRNDYANAASEKGFSLIHIERDRPGMSESLESADAIIVFTNKISHEAKRKAAHSAKKRSIPLITAHSCGVSTLRRCLAKSLDKQGLNIKPTCKPASIKYGGGAA